MSIAVDLSELDARIAERGAQAFLVTVGEGAAPHVVSVVVDLDDDRLTMGAGRSSRANLAARRSATILWGATPGDAYSLIVDGVLDADRTTDDAVAVQVTSAVLHRLAGAPGDGPTCIRVIES